MCIHINKAIYIQINSLQHHLHQQLHMNADVTTVDDVSTAAEVVQEGSEEPAKVQGSGDGGRHTLPARGRRRPRRFYKIRSAFY